MKKFSAEKILVSLLLVIFGGIVLHAPMSIWLGTVFPEQSMTIKAWKEVLMGVALVLLVGILSRRHKWSDIFADWVIRLAGVYALVYFMLLIPLWQGAEAAIAGMFIDLRYVLFFVLVYSTLRLFPGYRRLFIYTCIVGALFVVAFSVLQVFVLPPDVLAIIGYGKTTIMPYLTVDMNHDYIRINSTLRGPNPLGAYAMILLALCSALAVSGMYKKLVGWQKVVFYSLIIGSLVALWWSYSRSALGATGIAAGVVVAAGFYQKIPRKVWVGGFIVVGIIGGLLFAARDSHFVANVILHENPQGGSVTKSNDGHIDSLQDGTARLIRQPFGAGIGSTGSASLDSDEPLIIKNQYLFIAHESGWLGLALFMALFSLILQRLWHRKEDWLALGVLASGVGLAVIGLLQPVWVDDTVSIVWWGLAGIALGGVYGKRRKSK